jgi:hypothetical protein
MWKKSGGNMNVVGRFFLRAKHWQIFILVCGVYIVGQVVLVGAMLATPPSLESFAKGGLAAGLVMAFSTLSIFLWFWSLGAFFCSIVQPELKMKSGFFRVALIYPPFYFVFFVATFQDSSPGLLGLILPLHLFAMVCMFYLLYFVAKSLVLAETSKPASFSDYAGPFFLLWFFPVGIWIVQPRVNRLYSGRKNFEFPVETNPQ